MPINQLPISINQIQIQIAVNQLTGYQLIDYKITYNLTDNLLIH